MLCFSSEARPTSGIKGRNGDGCKRCGYEVYAAEQMISKNKVMTIFQNLIAKNYKLNINN